MKDVTILTSNGVNVEKSLELFGDMEMYDATLNDFLEDVDKKIEALKKYRESGDMPNYAIEVHALKSDARYLGFVTLADLAYDLELKSKANDIMYVYEHHDGLFPGYHPGNPKAGHIEILDKGQKDWQSADQ